MELSVQLFHDLPSPGASRSAYRVQKKSHASQTRLAAGESQRPVSISAADYYAQLEKYARRRQDDHEPPPPPLVTWERFLTGKEPPRARGQAVVAPMSARGHGTTTLPPWSPNEGGSRLSSQLPTLLGDDELALAAPHRPELDRFAKRQVQLVAASGVLGISPRGGNSPPHRRVHWLARMHASAAATDAIEISLPSVSPPLSPSGPRAMRGGAVDAQPHSGGVAKPPAKPSASAFNGRAPGVRPPDGFALSDTWPSHGPADEARTRTAAQSATQPGAPGSYGGGAATARLPLRPVPPPPLAPGGAATAREAGRGRAAQHRFRPNAPRPGDR